MTDEEQQITETLDGVVKAATSRFSAALLSPEAVQAAQEALAQSPIVRSRTEAMRTALMAAIAEAYQLAPHISNVPSKEMVAAAMTGRPMPRNTRPTGEIVKLRGSAQKRELAGREVVGYDCPNCGGDGTAFDGGPCPACEGEGWIPS